MSIAILLASFVFIAFFHLVPRVGGRASRAASPAWARSRQLADLRACAYPIDKAIHLGLDLQGGTEFLLEVQGDNVTPSALDQASSVIRKRLDTLGTREISIRPEGTNRLKIQIPGLQGAERVADPTQLLARGQAGAAHGAGQRARNPRRGPRPTAASCLLSTRPITKSCRRWKKATDGKDVGRRSWSSARCRSRATTLVRARRGIGLLGQPNVEFQLDEVGHEFDGRHVRAVSRPPDGHRARPRGAERAHAADRPHPLHHERFRARSAART